MFDRVPFGVVIGPVVFSSAPNEIKLTLGLAALEVVESHVIQLGRFWDHGFGAEALRCLVVSDDRSFGLWVPHFLQGDS